MQRFSKYTLPLVAVLVSTVGISNSALAQYGHETDRILGDYNNMIQDMQKFTAIVERQNALRGPCNNGNQRACAEIRRLDKKLQE
ncbi:MAG: hypothetical protein AB4063_00200 [Crocosphaera sp.]